MIDIDRPWLKCRSLPPSVCRRCSTERWRQPQSPASNRAIAARNWSRAVSASEQRRQPRRHGSTFPARGRSISIMPSSKRSRLHQAEVGTRPAGISPPVVRGQRELGSGMGDVRPIGAGASGVATQGTIAPPPPAEHVISPATNFPTVGPVPPSASSRRSTTAHALRPAPSLPAASRPSGLLQRITVINRSVTSGPAGSIQPDLHADGRDRHGHVLARNRKLPSGLTLARTAVSPARRLSRQFPIHGHGSTDSQGCTGVGRPTRCRSSVRRSLSRIPPSNSGVAGSPFSQTFTQKRRSRDDDVFSLASGTLPNGLTLARTECSPAHRRRPERSRSPSERLIRTAAPAPARPTHLTITCQTITVTKSRRQQRRGRLTVQPDLHAEWRHRRDDLSRWPAARLPRGLTLAANGTLSGYPHRPAPSPSQSRQRIRTLQRHRPDLHVDDHLPDHHGHESGRIERRGRRGLQPDLHAERRHRDDDVLARQRRAPGRTHTASNGTLSGAPTQTGTFNDHRQGNRPNGCSGTGPTYSLTITCQTITVTNPAVEHGRGRHAVQPELHAERRDRDDDVLAGQRHAALGSLARGQRNALRHADRRRNLPDHRHCHRRQRLHGPPARPTTSSSVARRSRSRLPR